MNTKVVKVDREHPDQEKINGAGEVLKQGGLVAFPTETVYCRYGKSCGDCQGSA